MIVIFICKKISLRGVLPALPVICLLFALALGNSAGAAGTVTAEYADIPVIMYHSITDRPSRAGDYLVLPETFYNDMKYLSDIGRETVTAAQVYDYAANGGELPESAVIITFDDGFLNNLTYALPVLEEFDMCGTVNIVGSYSEKAAAENDPDPNYAYLTANDISYLAESGRFEIGSHTYDMHSLSGRRGCSRNYDESDKDYTDALLQDCNNENRFLLENCGLVTDVFAYPYGYISEGSKEILVSCGYKILFTCREKHNIIEKNSLKEGEPLLLNRYNRAYGLSSEDFMEKAGIN